MLQGWLLATPMTANQISMLGIVFAALGAAALVAAPGSAWLFLAGAVGIQLRLLANMMDGLVAVEGGRGSPTGALWNEVPDRLEDGLLLVGFGYAVGLAEVGYGAAILAVFTAYVRAVGASHGLGQDFRGPMAKQHRMAALTLGCVAAFVEASLGGTVVAARVILIVILVGTAVTGLRRLIGIARALEVGGR